MIADELEREIAEFMAGNSSTRLDDTWVDVLWQSRHVIDLVRKATLEEAAQLCDARVDLWDDKERRAEARGIAAQLRKLVDVDVNEVGKANAKEKEETEETTAEKSSSFTSKGTKSWSAQRQTKKQED